MGHPQRKTTSAEDELTVKSNEPREKINCHQETMCIPHQTEILEGDYIVTVFKSLKVKKREYKPHERLGTEYRRI